MFPLKIHKRQCCLQKGKKNVITVIHIGQTFLFGEGGHFYVICFAGSRQEINLHYFPVSSVAKVVVYIYQTPSVC